MTKAGLFQVSGSMLEMCVLAALRQEDAYGYKLTQDIRQVVDISESTLYPVLRRLKKEGLLETYDEPYDGRNRRYYHLSEEGKIRLESLMQEWMDFTDRIDNFVGCNKPGGKN